MNKRKEFIKQEKKWKEDLNNFPERDYNFNSLSGKKPVSYTHLTLPTKA